MTWLGGSGGLMAAAVDAVAQRQKSPCAEGGRGHTYLHHMNKRWKNLPSVEGRSPDSYSTEESNLDWDEYLMDRALVACCSVILVRTEQNYRGMQWWTPIHSCFHYSAALLLINFSILFIVPG